MKETKLVMDKEDKAILQMVIRIRDQQLARLEQRKRVVLKESQRDVQSELFR